MRRVTPESGLLRAVTDLLTAERVWWCRMNTGTQVLEAANGKRRVFRAGRPGMADLLALVEWDPAPVGGPYLAPRPLAALWIELKALRGIQSPAQKAFQAEVEREGHAYLLARSTDDVVRFLKGCK